MTDRYQGRALDDFLRVCTRARRRDDLSERVTELRRFAHRPGVICPGPSEP